MAVFLDFKRQLKLWLEHIVHHVSDLQEETILFISFGPKDHRCSVWHSEKTVLSQATLQLFDFIDDQFSPDQLPDYIKIDVAYNLEKQSWNQIEQQVHHQFHNNHYRRGIGFDDSCSVAFLEQEIYGKAIIRGLSYDKPNFFDETNLNYAIKQKYRAAKPEIRLQSLQEVWTFDTYATFYENGQFINLASRYDANGIRAIASNKKQHFRDLIEKNAAFLHSQIQENGKFIYGYFPAYDRDIRNYNTVRHCTSLYALLETFEVQDKPEYWPKIVAAIQYALTTFYKEKDPITAFMIDGKEGELEIKLGANAAAILMLTKYQEITGKDGLKSNDIQISMDGKGRWVDNVMVERLWRSVKYEEVYLKAYSNVLDAKKQLNAYFEFYNLKRPHSSLDKMTPDEFYYDQLPQQNKVA